MTLGAWTFFEYALYTPILDVGAALLALLHPSPSYFLIQLRLTLVARQLDWIAGSECALLKSSAPFASSSLSFRVSGPRSRLLNTLNSS